MRTWMILLLTLSLLAPGWAGDDPPKPPNQAKDEETKKTPADEFKELTAEFAKIQRDQLAAYRTEDQKEQRKLMEEVNKKIKELAGRCVAFAKNCPDEKLKTDAYFLAVQRGLGGEAHQEATDWVSQQYLPKADLADVQKRFARLFLSGDDLYLVILDRVEKEPEHKAALPLLNQIASMREGSKAGTRASELIFTKFIESDKLDTLCRTLASGRDKQAEQKLKTILEKNPHAAVKAAAVLGLASLHKTLAEKPGLADAKRAELEAKAEQYYQTVIKDYAANKQAAAQAKGELNEMKYLGIGKTAPALTGPDLDGKEFALADYKGKVILLDFWGHW